MERQILEIKSGLCVWLLCPFSTHSFIPPSFLFYSIQTAETLLDSSSPSCVCFFSFSSEIKSESIRLLLFSLPESIVLLFAFAEQRDTKTVGESVFPH